MEKIDYSNHESKCRLCFKHFGPDEHRMQVTKPVEKRFRELTNSDLKVLDGLSKEICVVCNFQLKEFCTFKRNVVDSQRGLFKFISRNKKIKQEYEEVEIKTEKPDDTMCKFEPEVIVEPQSEFLDFSSGLDFDAYPEDIQESLDDDESKVNFDSLHSHAQTSKWNCSQCDASLSGSRSLRDHIAHAHLDTKPEVKCPMKSCSKVFSSTRKLRAHIKVHDDDSKEMCTQCGLLVTSKHNLQKHIKRVHLKLKNFFCDICGYGATFKHSIASHLVSHIDPKERRKWDCDVCSFVSVSKQSLRAHKAYEHSGQVFVCHCGKQFNQRASLTTHIKCVHHKIKDHTCNLCGKAYFSRNDLKHHKKSQHQEKDMPCDICGKLFATPKHLTRHRMYHEEPRFKCKFDGCQKAFIDNAKLKDHMKLHEGNRDHLCHLCEKSYFHQKDLKRHLDVAHKATIFYCEICTFTISRKDYLRNHLNSAHKHLTVEQKNEILARTKVTRNAV